jgi:UDP-N-acetylglucosamine 2-epimerase (non-hydrolysing)
MNQQFFDELGIPEPDIDLEVGSASHAVQTAEIMKRFEPVVDDVDPAAVLVVGDVNSTIACSLVAVKKGVPVVHVEAGLRSGDLTMPEEINRLLTDRISDLLFTTEKDADDNLVREGVERSKIHFVGNVMIDSLLSNLDNAVSPEETLARYGRGEGQRIEARGYGLVTLHRPSNVDDPAMLGVLLETLRIISDHLPLVFPVHPRTMDRMKAASMIEGMKGERVLLLPPVGYLELLGLLRDAKLVLTDSGGLQEESTALGVPCITLRDNTERPVTVSHGTNTIVGSDREAALEVVESVLRDGGKGGNIPDLWDGKAAQRIAEVMGIWLRGRDASAAEAVVGR